MNRPGQSHGGASRAVSVDRRVEDLGQGGTDAEGREQCVDADLAPAVRTWKGSVGPQPVEVSDPPAERRPPGVAGPGSLGDGEALSACEAVGVGLGEAGSGGDHVEKRDDHRDPVGRAVAETGVGDADGSGTRGTPVASAHDLDADEGQAALRVHLGPEDTTVGQAVPVHADVARRGERAAGAVGAVVLKMRRNGKFGWREEARWSSHSTWLVQPQGGGPRVETGPASHLYAPE